MYNNQAQDNGQSVISVRGEGTVTAQPDTATVLLGVRTESLNLQEAQHSNSQISHSVIGSLIRIGIKKEDIRTSDYRIDPMYSYEDGKQIFQGYRVTHLLNIIIAEPQKTGLAVDTAVQNGANEVASIQFSIANPQAYNNYALRLAVLEAVQKAETIANTIGATLERKPLSIIEEPRRMPGPYVVASFEKMGAPGTPILAGKITINATVKAQFRFF
ncbi:SIMPL domain-containing protein [Bacillus sp. T33-2]|uniref:SIMPL domain-containing protein n=1 Tax=Bacillus sp. T33-2 TaxID=2054168 RepID=UPI000C76DA83|nr:SIMPL domain-containing protein [Bacillus sp. T33-2]PLR99894.1 hypothetical protein CVD19_02235 [Bacillus sp. T33-2]